jgi:hypothetical protein
VALEQLLAGQGWPKIPIVLAHQIERRVAERLAVSPVARPAALLRGKTAGAVTIIGLKKPVDLAAAEMKQLGSLRNSQPTLTDLLDDFKAAKFVLRQGNETRHDGSQSPVGCRVVAASLPFQLRVGQSTSCESRGLSHL